MFNLKITKMESNLVYVVTSYQNVVGAFECLDDAVQLVKETIAKNRPANIITLPLNRKSC